MRLSDVGISDDAVCLTFDVEWSTQGVIDDICSLLDERALKATFFVTHDGVHVGHHERGLHPNFRRNGETYRALATAATCSDEVLYRHVVRRTHAFAPEALGARSHSLFFDSQLLPIYAAEGLQYDATLRLELEPNLRPFWKQFGILEIPTYYADYYDMVEQRTAFDVRSLELAAPGLKVMDFHPNLVYINAPSVAFYDATRPFYKDAGRLSAARYSGRGTRTLFVELIDAIAAHSVPTATMGEINAACQQVKPRRSYV